MLIAGDGCIAKNDVPTGRSVTHTAFRTDEQVIEVLSRLTLGKSYATIKSSC